MRGWIVGGLVLVLLLITGCDSSQKENKASAEMSESTGIAYKDDFTRKFLESKKEVKDGYHLYKSMTDGYTVLFPVDAKIVKDEYAVNANLFEQYLFTEENKKHTNNYRVTYENRSITSDIDLNLKVLSNFAEYGGEYTEYQHEGSTYYYAKDVSETADKTNYHFISYIKSNQTDQAVSFYLDSTCSETKESCKIDPEKLEKEFKQIIESVKFSE